MFGGCLGDVCKCGAIFQTGCITESPKCAKAYSMTREACLILFSYLIVQYSKLPLTEYHFCKPYYKKPPRFWGGGMNVSFFLIRIMRFPASAKVIRIDFRSSPSWIRGAEKAVSGFALQRMLHRGDIRNTEDCQGD